MDHSTHWIIQKNSSRSILSNYDDDDADDDDDDDEKL